MDNKRLNKVLVIDRPGVARMLLCHYLEEASYNVTAVDTCADALDALNSSSYSLVLLDTFADPQDGLNFIHTARQRFPRHVLPIVLVTSMPAQEVEAIALEAGVNDFISKPVQRRELLARLNSHLELHHNHSTCRRDLEYLHQALRGAKEGAWDWDLLKQTIRYSERFKALLEPDNTLEITSSPQEWQNRVHPDDRERMADDLKQHINGATPFLVSQHRLVSSEHTVRWVMVKGQVWRDDNGHPYRLTGTISDISNSLMFDSVTGLSNVHVFCEWIRHMSASQQRSKGTHFALLAISLDQFETVRQSLDSSDFNQLLATLATRLHLSLRATDLISRLDTACFGALLTQAHGISSILKIAYRLQDTLGAPIILSSREFSVNVSIGIAFSTTKYERAEDMIKAASQAAEDAQQMGQRQTRLADSELAAMMRQRLNQEEQLRSALEQNQLATSFSPIVRANNQEIFAYQVVLNEIWGGKDYRVGDYQQWGNTPLAQAVDDWTLEATLSEALLWQKSERLRDTLICLPVHMTQLTEGRIFDFFENSMPERYRPHLHRLCLEVTEEALLQHTENVAFIASKLSQHGVHLGLSKVGMNQTSLRLLTLLPIKYLKLSPKCIDATGKYSALLRLLKAIGTELGISIVATGINSDKFRSIALEQGINLLQGRVYPDISEIPLDQLPDYSKLIGTDWFK